MVGAKKFGTWLPGWPNAFANYILTIAYASESKNEDNIQAVL